MTEKHGFTSDTCASSDAGTEPLVPRLLVHDCGRSTSAATSTAGLTPASVAWMEPPTDSVDSVKPDWPKASVMQGDAPAGQPVVCVGSIPTSKEIPEPAALSVAVIWPAMGVDFPVMTKVSSPVPSVGVMPPPSVLKSPSTLMPNDACD